MYKEDTPFMKLSVVILVEKYLLSFLKGMFRISLFIIYPKINDKELLLIYNKHLMWGPIIEQKTLNFVL